MSDDPLLKPAQFLPGVGPARAELLKKLGIETVGDLLWHLPREVLDLTDVRDPGDLKDKEMQTVRGRVVDMDARLTRKNMTLVAGLIDCGSDYVRGTWFNQPWMLHKLKHGDWVLFSGKPRRHQGRWEFSHPRVQMLDDDDQGAGGGVLPKYGLTEGLKMHELRRIIRTAVEQAAAGIPEHLPEAYRQQLDLPALPRAIRQVHVPRTIDEYQAGRRRLLFDDLFEFQLGIALRRRVWRQSVAPALPTSAKIDARIRRLFPFRLTSAQDKAIVEITGDLAERHAMHRLLQADVGAGKTVVAVYAMLVAVAAGYQAALMAPTELLAQQHGETVDGILSHSRVSRAVLTGSASAAERRRVLAGLQSGEIQLVIGTQAVIQSDVRFAKLGLAVVDEQHKFGVAQRAAFSSGGDGSAHVLVMTATPIPRSLCLTQFGDLDLSVMSEPPPGRQRVVTSRIHSEAAERKAWDFVRRQIAGGRQAYIVCPRVDSSEGESSVGGAAAEQTFCELQAGELRGLRVGLVHGQMDRGRRTEVMNAFRDGEIQALVATTVIEVGVDVPNATLMVILDAERFGLSQLHQLRGRIARGRHQGYCFLFSQAVAPESAERLAALETTADGFVIAERDFELRGPGDVLGTRQHGELPLRVASLVRDTAILAEAREAAFALVQSGEFDAAAFAPLKIRVFDRFSQVMDLPQTG